MSKKEVYSNMRYSETVHQEAYQLFLQGYACRKISETCHVPLPTIYLWQRRWREKLSGQTLKDLPLEDVGTLLLTAQALRRELEEAQRDLQILHESGILRTIPIRDRSLFARKYADQVPYIYKVFELSSSAFFRYRKESAAPSERAKQQALYRKEVQRIFLESGGRFGAEQIRQKLRRKGIRLSKKRIRQMMDAMGLISCEPLQTEYLPRQPEVPFVAEGSHVEIL